MLRFSLLTAACALFLSAQAPQGWYLGGGMAESYEASVDRENKRSGGASGHLKSKVIEPATKFGNLMQTISAEQFRGKKVRLTGYVKTAGNPDGAFMWLRADTPANSRLDNMADRLIRETTDWRKSEIIMDVPQNAVALALGFALNGKGELWVDDVSFEIAPADASSTVRYPDLPVPAGTEERYSGYLKKMESAPKAVVNGSFEQ